MYWVTLVQSLTAVRWHTIADMQSYNWQLRTDPQSSILHYMYGKLKEYVEIVVRAWPCSQIVGEYKDHDSGALQCAYSLMLQSWGHHHKVASHCISVHFSAFKCISVQCIGLHWIALHFSTFHCIAVHFSAVHFIALHSSAVQYISVHCSAFQCSTVHLSALQCIGLHIHWCRNPVGTTIKLPGGIHLHPRHLAKLPSCQVAKLPSCHIQLASSLIIVLHCHSAGMIWHIQAGATLCGHQSIL